MNWLTLSGDAPNVTKGGAMKNILLKTRSLVLTSDRLFQRIVEAVDGVLPKKLTWKDFISTVAAERELVLISPPIDGRTQGQLVPTSLFIEEITGGNVRVRVLFPLWGPAAQQDKILKTYLAKLGLEFSVQAGGIVLEIILPFVPVEVKFGRANGKNGEGQRAFICPEEVVEVS
ncbi:MAG: hypothetical protein ABSB00_00330 [Minisyncoccia bacterium]